MVIGDLEDDRNGGYTENEIENEYCRTLGLDNIIWVPYTSVYDDKYYMNKTQKGKALVSFTLQGHIDGYARFVSDNIILYQENIPELDRLKMTQEEDFRMK